MEGAPLALGDKNVARLCQSIDQLAEIFGKAARRCGEGLIDRLPQGVFEILGEANIHETDRRSCFAEGFSSCLMMPVWRSMRTRAVVLGSSSSMLFHLSD